MRLPPGDVAAAAVVLAQAAPARRAPDPAPATGNTSPAGRTGR
ncbi:hypothetical protein ACF1HJ_27145 [Streptomyces sp. NPDC013978]